MLNVYTKYIKATQILSVDIVLITHRIHIKLVIIVAYSIQNFHTSLQRD